MEEEQYKNIVLGPRYAVALRDLRGWHALRIRCWACKHEGFVAPALLRRRHAEHTRLMELEARMVCGQCGNREGNTWGVVQLPR